MASTLVVLLIANVALAQNTTRNKEGGTFGARRQLATIIFAGLSGAILGLSTLSFYGRPQDRLSNIAVGFALGIFAGTIYTTYKAASKPSDFYGPGAGFFPPSNQFQYANNSELFVRPVQFEWSF
ncbi:MAG: hypothetical protein A4S09_08670 [Proteobacteria bacterium SG_bin7]|nr:MAG: hypothetical protein A4S09_08670 [Proteobacteria bacterium SG_bin7]